MGRRQQNGKVWLIFADKSYMRTNDSIIEVKNWGIGFAIVLTQILSPGLAFAADTSIAELNLSGNVPTVFSLTIRGLPGDLDLTPGVSVVNRLLGILHFRYNADIASLTIESDNDDGVPIDGNAVAYTFGAGGFTVSIPAACAAVDEAEITGLSLAGSATLPVEIADTTALTAGVIEDCDLTASWDGTTDTLPLAGKYTMAIIFTFTSI